MRIAIIGGTGHIGSFLIPRLFAAGYAVICISRGLKEPYRQDPAWKLIQRVEMDRVVEEQAGRPRYSSLAALRESVNWLIDQSVVHAGR